MATLIAGYVVFFAATWWARHVGGLRFVGDDGFARRGSALIILHAIGIVAFLLPAFATLGVDVRIFNNTSGWPLVVPVLSAVLAAAIAFTQARKTSLLLRAKPAGIKRPNATFAASYFALRICFIVVYEWWFRGVLLLFLAATYGLTTSIIVNIILYSAVHIVNGKREALSCIPFGLLLCGLCLWNDAVWPAIVVHLALTLAYEAGVVAMTK